MFGKGFVGGVPVFLAKPQIHMILSGESIDGALLEGVDTLKQVLSKGFTERARHFNTVQKYKHIKLQTMPV